MSQESRSILESTLGGLLGFDDGAGDVLDHLLTIESREDLLEYLSQLLGDATPKVLEFVDNIGRYQHGEPLVLSLEEGTAPTSFQDSKPAASRSGAGNSSNPGKKAPPTPSGKRDALQSRRQNNPTSKKQTKSRVPPPKKTAQTTIDASPQAQLVSTASKNTASTTSSEPNPSPPRVVEKSRPTRGTAKIVCGCYGTKHKPLTNCLYCGRISCIEEGYDFCAFCGYMVEEIKDETHGNDQAWIQKERLLRFDREFARRTEIFDDQEDYHGPSTWMTQEEQQQALDSDEQRLEALKRPKQTLNIAM